MKKCLYCGKTLYTRLCPECSVKPSPFIKHLAQTPENGIYQTLSNSLVCPECGKECKSALGLQGHMRSHK